MTWKDSFTFVDDASISHKVGDRTLRFWPVSVGTAFKLKKIIPTIAKASSALFENNDRDSAIITRKTPDGEETISEAISPELAELRHNQRQKAVEMLSDAFTSEENQRAIGEIIMDSLREVFPDKSERPPATEFLNSLPLPAVADLIVGVALANKGVFGPLGRLVGERIQRARDRVVENLETQARTTGEISPTKSSGLPVSATSL